MLTLPSSVVEVNLAIVCACAPCLRALVGRFFPSLFGRHDASQSLYAVPVSQVARRLPESAHSSGPEESNLAATGWRTANRARNWTPFGSENSCNLGRGQSTR